MLPISPQILAALPSVIRRPTRAEWSNDGGQTWHDCGLSDGKISADRTAETRYQADAVLTGVEMSRDEVNTVSTQVRLWQGVVIPRTSVEWIPAGRYKVTGAEVLRTGSVAVELDGLEDELRRAEFPIARVIGPDSARVLTEQLVAEALPGEAVAWRPGVAADTTIPAVFSDGDRWDVLSSSPTGSGSGGIAQAIGAELFFDASGIPTMAPIPTLDDPVVWRIGQGTGGVLVEPATQQSSDGLFNIVAATGDGGGGTEAVGPVVVWDDDPNSLTYAGPDPVNDPLAPQRLGLPWVRLRTMRYSSALLTSVGQAEAAARALLADSLGVQSSLSLTAICNPALEAGDVVEVEVSPGMWERHVIDSLSWSLGGTSMSCTTRTTSRRL
ncbi:phage tail protein [Streptomyces sp. NPDC056230]|uniref:phage tail protein n=1 Tax=Streptomyces sp. NPDC056230 TaxID=3345754 RepID=UPI0035DBDD92